MPDNNEKQLTIWGRANSVNVQKVLWCAEELGISYSASTPAWRSAAIPSPNISR